MECFFEAIFEIFGEFLIQFLAELLTDCFTRVVGRGKRKRRELNPAGRVVVYAIVGTGLGFLTVWLLPHAVIRNPNLRLANLMLGPIAAGLLMQQIGQWFVRHDRPRTGLETFASGFAFALAFSLVRYFATAVR